MGGFTAVYLKDKSQKNIDQQNQRLKECGVRYRFYSVKDVRFEYESFIAGKGYFPAHQFPIDKIHSFVDFRKYWNTKALGETFCPKFGSLTFDCYFGRTSQRQMKALIKYFTENTDQIKSVSGSFSTLLEKAGTKKAVMKLLNYGVISK